MSKFIVKQTVYNDCGIEVSFTVTEVDDSVTLEDFIRTELDGDEGFDEESTQEIVDKYDFSEDNTECVYDESEDGGEYISLRIVNDLRDLIS